MEDVLAHYHALKRGEDPALWLRPTSSTRLHGRYSFGLTSQQYRDRRPLDLQRLRMHLSNRPEILGCKRPASSRTIALKLPASLNIAIDNFNQLQAYTKTHDVTINDVLLRDLFVTLNKWNARHVDKRGKKVIRLVIAVDMCREDDHDIPAANVLSVCFLDRRPQDIIDESDLLHSIRQETLSIKKNHLGMAFWRLLSWFSNVRGGFKILLHPNGFFPCHSTAVLSNLGQPLLASNLPRRNGSIVINDEAEIISIELMPPYRPNTPLAVGTATVGESLRITMHYNAEIFSSTEADELRTLFENQLKSTLSWELPIDRSNLDSSNSKGEALSCLGMACYKQPTLVE